MIHAYMNKGECHITIDTVKGDVIAETIALMHSLYDAVNSKDEAMGKMMKEFLTEHTDVLFTTDEEMEKKVQELKKDTISVKELNDRLESLLKALSEALEDADDED